MSISPALLISRRASVVGLASGNARDAEDTLNFAALRGVKTQIEVFPHADTQKAYDRMVRPTPYSVSLYARTDGMHSGLARRASVL